MLTFANCKINLGLFVTGKRPDGYHNLVSVFYPVDWADVVEVEKVNNRLVKCNIIEYGRKVGGDPTTNLCYKAYQLLDEKFSLPPVNIHLFKTLPMGAGLGGGSSNGSATLQLLNTTFQLGLTQQELMLLAAQLGSDCPFFILNEPSLVQGRGERLSPIEIDLSNFYLLLVHPGVHVSTAEAYGLLSPREIDFNLEEKITTSTPGEWKNFLRNDFEGPVFSKFPLIGEIKNNMYEGEAVLAMMSGSGSAVYGLFEKEENAKKVQELFKPYITRLILPKNVFAGFN